MFDRVRERVLRFLRVPHEPSPPAGAAGSVRVFRAGRNFYKIKLIGWSVGQVGALVGIVVSLYFLARIEREADELQERQHRQVVARAAAAKAEREKQAAKAGEASPTTAPGEAAPPTAASAPDAPAPPKTSQRKRDDSRRSPEAALARLVERSPSWVFPVLTLLEYGGVLLYLLQIPVTYAFVRLDYEQRWYIVTDRSLRIRAGITTVLESTMSFANLQQVEVNQGPLQRLLGIADLKVQSAGGGGGGEHPATAGDSLHTGVFHGVDNAHEIRDLILERLRKFRQAGLGDPDDHHVDDHDPTGTPPAAPGDTLVAAQELLTEARALRESVTRM